MKKLLILFALVFLPLMHCSKTSPGLEQVVLRGATMGTSYNIKIVTPQDLPIDAAALHEEIDTLLVRVNNITSTYIDSSELSQFNQSAAGEWIAVSSDLVHVFQVAMDISAQSDGAFDITVGPLVNLWGFGPEFRADDDVPSEEEIHRRKALVSWQNIHLRENPPALSKKLDGMYCDLSAIAKGWGVDRVGELLKSEGIENYLVEIGGEISALGVNAKGAEWRIGVSSPTKDNQIDKIIRVHNIGVATSGDYRNYFEKDGVRYSHTIDPRTGAPIRHGLASVTVIHPLCMMADAYATAIDVLGPIDGLKLAEEQHLAVLLIIKTDDGFVEKMTSSFKEFIAN